MKLPVEDFACIVMAAYRTITSLKMVMEHFMCELNSQTKEAKPETFQEVRGFLYFGSLYEREVGILSNLIERQGG